MIKVFITGMPGCGKSTFGNRIATSLNLPFFDLDKEIEIREKLSINEIFRQKGESYFRETESKTLREVTDRNLTFIMATGGGTPCFNDNIEFMNANGTTFYINAAIQDLLERLTDKGINKRPLLKAAAPNELEEKLTTQLESRKAFYEKCQYKLAYHESMENDFLVTIRQLMLSE